MDRAFFMSSTLYISFKKLPNTCFNIALWVYPAFSQSYFDINFNIFAERNYFLVVLRVFRVYFVDFFDFFSVSWENVFLKRIRVFVNISIEKTHSHADRIYWAIWQFFFLWNGESIMQALPNKNSDNLLWKMYTLRKSVLVFVRIQIQYRKSVKNDTFSSTNYDLFLKKEHFFQIKNNLDSKKKNIFGTITLQLINTI
jgi:hypothetical protein